MEVDFYDTIAPKKIDIGYCAGICERRVNKRLEILFKLGMNRNDVFESVKREMGCCVPAAFSKRSVTYKNGETVVFKKLVVESCR